MTCRCERDADGLITRECISCEARIANAESARSGVDMDPSGRMADRAADRWEDSL